MPQSLIGRGAELEALQHVREASGPRAKAVRRGDKWSSRFRQDKPALAELRRQSRASQFAIVGYQTGKQVPLAAAADLLRGLAKVPAAGARVEEIMLGRRGAGDGGAVETIRLFEASHRALLHIRDGVELAGTTIALPLRRSRGRAATVGTTTARRCCVTADALAARR
jgi:hypothetical protein